MCGEAAFIEIKVQFSYLRLFFFLLLFSDITREIILKIKRNNRLEWELLSLCCGVWPLIVIYRVGWNKYREGRAGVLQMYWPFSIAMEMLKSIAGLKLRTGLTVAPWVLLHTRLLCVVHWTILLWKFKSEIFVRWNNCTWLWMSYFTS